MNKTLWFVKFKNSNALGNSDFYTVCHTFVWTMTDCVEINGATVEFGHEIEWVQIGSNGGENTKRWENWQDFKKEYSI